MTRLGLISTNRGYNSMSRATIVIALILTLSFLTSCAPSVYTLPEAEREGITWNDYNRNFNDVYSASVGVLQDDGYIIENTDRQTGLIVTDWKQSDSITQRIFLGDSRVKYSVNVREMDSDLSRVTINVQRQNQGSFGRWEQQKVTKQNANDLLIPIFESISNRLHQN